MTVEEEEAVKFWDANDDCGYDYGYDYGCYYGDNENNNGDDDDMLVCDDTLSSFSLSKRRFFLISILFPYLKIYMCG
jgi:hypothetical protein